MNAGKVKDVFKSWVQSGYRFGYGFSNMVADKLEASAKEKKVGGGIFDVVAGAGITYLAASQIIGTIAVTGMALASIAVAPVTAIAAVAVGTVFTALNCIMGGVGLGLLSSARDKSGISLPGFSSAGKGAAASLDSTVKSITASVKSAFKSDRKASADFRKSADGQKPAAPAETAKAPANDKKPVV